MEEDVCSHNISELRKSCLKCSTTFSKLQAKICRQCRQKDETFKLYCTKCDKNPISKCTHAIRELQLKCLDEDCLGDNEVLNTNFCDECDKDATFLYICKACSTMKKTEKVVEKSGLKESVKEVKHQTAATSILTEVLTKEKLEDQKNSTELSTICDDNDKGSLHQRKHEIDDSINDDSTTTDANVSKIFNEITTKVSNENTSLPPNHACTIATTENDTDTEFEIIGNDDVAATFPRVTSLQKPQSEHQLEDENASLLLESDDTSRNELKNDNNESNKEKKSTTTMQISTQKKHPKKPAKSTNKKPMSDQVSESKDQSCGDLATQQRNHQGDQETTCDATPDQTTINKNEDNESELKPKSYGNKMFTKEDKHDSNEDKYDSNEDKHDSSEDKHDSNEDKHDSNEDKHDSSEDKHDSNEDKHDSNENKHDSNEDKHHSSEDKHDSNEDKHDSNENKHDSNEDKLHDSNEDKHDSVDDTHDSNEDKHDPVDDTHDLNEDKPMPFDSNDTKNGSNNITNDSCDVARKPRGVKSHSRDAIANSADNDNTQDQTASNDHDYSQKISSNNDQAKTTKKNEDNISDYDNTESYQEDECLGDQKQQKKSNFKTNKQHVNNTLNQKQKNVSEYVGRNKTVPVTFVVCTPEYVCCPDNGDRLIICFDDNALCGGKPEDSVFIFSNETSKRISFTIKKNEMEPFYLFREDFEIPSDIINNKTLRYRYFVRDRMGSFRCEEVDLLLANSPQHKSERGVKRHYIFKIDNAWNRIQFDGIVINNRSKLYNDYKYLETICASGFIYNSAGVFSEETNSIDSCLNFFQVLEKSILYFCEERCKIENLKNKIFARCLINFCLYHCDENDHIKWFKSLVIFQYAVKWHLILPVKLDQTTVHVEKSVLPKISPLECDRWENVLQLIHQSILGRNFLSDLKHELWYCAFQTLKTKQIVDDKSVSNYVNIFVLYHIFFTQTFTEEQLLKKYNSNYKLGNWWGLENIPITKNDTMTEKMTLNDWILVGATFKKLKRVDVAIERFWCALAPKEYKYLKAIVKTTWVSDEVKLAWFTVYVDRKIKKIDKDDISKGNELIANISLNTSKLGHQTNKHVYLFPITLDLCDNLRMLVYDMKFPNKELHDMSVEVLNLLTALYITCTNEKQKLEHLQEIKQKFSNYGIAYGTTDAKFVRSATKKFDICYQTFENQEQKLDENTRQTVCEILEIAMVELMKNQELTSIFDIVEQGKVNEKLVEKLLQQMFEKVEDSENATHENVEAPFLEKLMSFIRDKLTQKCNLSERTKQFLTKLTVDKWNHFSIQQSSTTTKTVPKEINFALRWTFFCQLLVVDQENKQRINQLLEHSGLDIFEKCKTAMEKFVHTILNNCENVTYEEIDIYKRNQSIIKKLVDMDKEKLLEENMDKIHQLKLKFDNCFKALKQLFQLFTITYNNQLSSYTDLESIKSKFNETYINTQPIGILMLEESVENYFLENSISSEDLKSLDIYFHYYSKSTTFKFYLCECVQSEIKNTDTPLNFSQVVKCAHNAWKKWYNLGESFQNETILIEDVWLLCEYNGMTLEELMEDIQLFNDKIDKTEWYHDCCKKLKKMQHMNNLKAICQLIEQVYKIYKIKGNIEILEPITQMTTSAGTTLGSIQVSDLQSYSFLSDVIQLKCALKVLESYTKAFKLINWMNSEKGIANREELKTFFDIAMIYVGDSGDMEQQKIESFYQSAQAFDVLIFNLCDTTKNQIDVEIFVKKYLFPVCLKCEQDESLIDKLNETSNRIEWISNVKETQGSVEKSTMKIIESVLENGKIEIGKHVNSENNIIVRTQQTNFSGELTYEDIKDLQSKLMLIAGQNYDKKEKIEQFITLTELLFRLIAVVAEFIRLCNPICEGLSLEIFLRKTNCGNFVMELEICNKINKASGFSTNVKNSVELLCESLENALQKWKKKKLQYRELKEYHALNFFSEPQLNYLQKEIAKYFVAEIPPPNPNVFDMLAFFNPTMSTEFVEQAVMKVIVQRSEDLFQVSENTKGLVDEIKEALEGDGHVGDIQNNTINIVFRTYDFSEDKDKQHLFEYAINIAEQLTFNPKYTAKKQTKEVQWNTLDSVLLSVSTNINEEICEYFNNVWDVFLKNFDISQADFLSLKDLGCFLKELYIICNKDKMVSNEFEKQFEKKKIKLYCVEQQTQLNCVLQIFKLAYNRLPWIEQVLICSETTTKDDIGNFLRRSICEQNKNAVYTIMNADSLSYDVSIFAENYLTKCLDMIQNAMKSYLCVFQSKENQKLFPFCNALQTYADDWPEKVFDTNIQQWIKCNLQGDTPIESQVIWITSERPGMGKSLACQKIAKEHKLEENIFSWHESELNTNEIFRYLFSKEHTIHEKVLYHIDLASEVITGFNSTLIQLFLLGGIENSKGHIWRRRPHYLFLLEHTPNNRNKAALTLLNMLPTVTCYSPNKSLNCENITNPWVQSFHKDILNDIIIKRPTAYLMASTNMCENNPIVIDITNTINPQTALQAIIKECGITDPSWKEIIVFLKFFNKQLENFESSAFCDSGGAMEQELPGFRNFVINFLLQMTHDFSLRSVEISDESLQKHQLKNSKENEGQCLSKYSLRQKWEQRPHPYLVFNQNDGTFTFFGFDVDTNGNLIDSTTKEVLKRSIMSKDLRNRLHSQRVPLQDNFDNASRRDKICRLRRVFGYDESTFFDPDTSYEITPDNARKMLAIYMRLSCDTPVVIMGETGCGKTKLVTFLASLLQPDQHFKEKKYNDEEKELYTNVMVIRIHGGTSEQLLIEQIEQAVNLSRRNVAYYEQYRMYTIAFFDEINTTKAVGLMKEIMCDGRIRGKNIDFSNGLKIIAACNPYRQHSETVIERLENSGLGYRVRKNDTKDTFETIPMRQLVYRVQPMPFSLLNLVWDFGALLPEAEEKYIRKMIESNLVRCTQPAQKLNAEEQDMFFKILQFSQNFIRDYNDETQFVSLREVERVIQILKWFQSEGSFIFQEIDNFCEKEAKKQNTTYQALTIFQRQIILTISICYHARLDANSKHRFVKEICEKIPNLNTKKQEFLREIDAAHRVVLRDITLPPGIALNKALLENVFVMVVCINLRIPLFLIGKPGSSKSLAKSIVKSAMVGKNSQSNFFKHVKNSHLMSFQCSPWSTSDGIIKLFKQCGNLQRNKDRNTEADVNLHLNTYVAVVVLDEIGLAEDSDQMPLKSLHSLLEDGSVDSLNVEPYQKVGFIGISNWALDPAKMNRGLCVQRDVPDKEDLIITATGICGTNVTNLNEYLSPLVDFYLEIQKSTGNKEFFGLRDYFALVKTLVFDNVSKKLVTDIEIFDIAKAVKRNFSGYDDIDPIDVFQNLTKGFSQKILKQIKEICVTKEALSSSQDQRYILFITQNYSGFKMIFTTIKEKNVIHGSSFPKDQEYTKICRDINKIKICMERGETVVLMNMDALYESLYDVLNQYYETCGKERYVDLGLGTHRLKCKIHPNFRIIVIAERDTVMNKFPIPLINRLEKHSLTSISFLSHCQQTLYNHIKEWVNEFCKVNKNQTNPKPSEIFIGFHDDAIGMLLQETEGTGLTEEQVIEYVKKQLLYVATAESVSRLNETSNLCKETEKLKKCYFSQHHENITHFLKSYTFNKKLLQITTFDRLLTNTETVSLFDNVDNQFRSVTEKRLNNYDTETEFTKMLKTFFSKKERSLLILQYEAFSPDYERHVSSAKFLIEDYVKKETENCVILIIKLTRSHVNPFSGFDTYEWNCVHLEEFVTTFSLNIEYLINHSMQQCLDYAIDHVEDDEMILNVELLFKQCVNLSVSFLRDTKSAITDRCNKRATDLHKLLQDKSSFKTIGKYIVDMLKFQDDNCQTTLYKPDEWLNYEARKTSEVIQAGTFNESIWRTLRQRIAPLFSIILSYIDRNSNFDTLAQKDIWMEMLQLSDIRTHYQTALKQLPNERCAAHQIQVQNDYVCKFPFSWVLMERMRKLIKENQENWKMQFEETDVFEIFKNFNLLKFEDYFLSDLIEVEIGELNDKFKQIVSKVLKNKTQEEKNASSKYCSLFDNLANVKVSIILAHKIVILHPELLQNLQELQFNEIGEVQQALVDAFQNYLEDKKLFLNTPEKRLEWIKIMNNAYSAVEAIAETNTKKKTKWQKILCVFLFLRNVSIPFDKETKLLQENIIKPITLWTSLHKKDKDNVGFNELSTYEDVEQVLSRMDSFLKKVINAQTQCVICKEENVQEYYNMKTCNHQACVTCWNQIKSNKEQHCPLEECGKQIEFAIASNVKALQLFHQRCNNFFMEIVHRFTFGNPERQPTQELCNHLILYVTKQKNENGISYFNDESDDKSVVFRSFILQQLLRCGLDDMTENIVNEHLKEAQRKMTDNDVHTQKELQMIILNCLEDIEVMNIAKQDDDHQLSSAFVLLTHIDVTRNINVTEMELQDIRQLAKCRVGLYILAREISRDTWAEKSRTLQIIKVTQWKNMWNCLQQVHWPRYYLLRCLYKRLGLHDCIELIKSNDVLKSTFRKELIQLDINKQLPELMLIYTEEFTSTRKKLFEMYTSNKKNTVFDDRQKNIAHLASATTLYRIFQVNKTENKSNKGIIETFLNVCQSTQRQWLSGIVSRFEDKYDHQFNILQIHASYLLTRNPQTSTILDFLIQLPTQLGKWFLPAMVHDLLFELHKMATEQMGQNHEKPTVYLCPNGHPFVIGNCGRPYAKARCADCKAPIGGASMHKALEGTVILKNPVDNSKHGFIDIADGIPVQPVRQLNIIAVSVLRLLQSLLLFPTDPQRFHQQFTNDLNRLSVTTGKSKEDAYLTLHLILKQLANDNTTVNYRLTDLAGRQHWEQILYEKLVQPITDRLQIVLDEANRVISQDDIGVTSELAKVVYETSNADRDDSEVAVWRYRQIISVEHAWQVFRELGIGKDRKLLLAVLKHEPVLRHVRHLPDIVQLCIQLTADYKYSIDTETAMSDKKAPMSKYQLRLPGVSDPINMFCEVWNDVRAYVNQAQFELDEEDVNYKMTSQSPIAVLLPHSKKYGKYIRAVVQVLVEANNEVMDSVGDSIAQSHIELKELRYQSTVICYDPSQDLLPLLLANCNYSLKLSETTNVEYNFLALEQQLLESFIRGKSRVSGYLPMMVYKDEYNVSELLEQIDDEVAEQKDVEIRAEDLPRELREVTGLADQLLTTGRLLLSGGKIRNDKLTEPLHQVMVKRYQMTENLLPDALQRSVTVQHLRSLWIMLDYKRWELLTQANFPLSSTDVAVELPTELINETEIKNQRTLILESIHQFAVVDYNPGHYEDYPLNIVHETLNKYEKAFESLPDEITGKHIWKLWQFVYNLR